jgi:hypothetical protein
MSISATEVSLRNLKRQAWYRAIVLVSLLPLAGCIASAPGGGGGGSKPITVTVTSSPTAPASVFVMNTSGMPDTVQYTATVTGTSDTAVTWTLSAYSNASVVCTATGSGLGTITTTGSNTMTYTAPSILPVSPCDVVVTATSSKDNVTTGQALVKVSVFVTINPAPPTIGQGANLQYAATVVGASSANQGIGWSAPSCTPCSNQQTGGAFDPNNPGLFIAPGLQSGTTQVVTTINATSIFDSNQSPMTTITVLKSDALGTATPSTPAAAQITCPSFTGGLNGATCYQLKVSCDAIADYYAYLKVNSPTGTPLGTVIFGTGTGGTSLYDNDLSFIVGSFNGGQTVVGDLLNLGVANQGFTTVQISFSDPFNPQPPQPNGWLQGPGGVRRVACRYATVADWVYKNIHNSNASAPYCATGNSGGSGAIGYAVTEYALASEFSMLEMTSGPVMTLLHQGCAVCGKYPGSDPCTQTQGNMCYSVSAGGTGSTAGIIDTAYQAQGQSTPTLCTDAVNGVNPNDPNFSRFLSDSIEDDPGVRPQLPIPDPPTTVNVVFGTMDTTGNAVPEGYAWWGGVGPQPPPPTCVATAPHAIPSDPNGAAQIVSDIQTSCKIH